MKDVTAILIFLMSIGIIIRLVYSITNASDNSNKILKRLDEIEKRIKKSNP